MRYFFIFWVVSATACWAQVTDREKVVVDEHLRYVTRSVSSPSLEMRLVFFHTSVFRLAVIDNGSGATAAYPSIEAAMRANNAVAGVNGGFFQRDHSPLGLMIAAGQRTGSFSRGSKLLSGVLYTDKKGIHLLRKAEFRDHAGIHALVQSGPFLVDRGTAVSGLSTDPARRRTFVLTDYRGNWVLGQCDAISLADLGKALANPSTFPEFTVIRALNLDGGTSCGLFFDRGAGNRDVVVSPYKRVSNFIGIVPR